MNRQSLISETYWSPIKTGRKTSRTNVLVAETLPVIEKLTMCAEMV